MDNCVNAGRALIKHEIIIRNFKLIINQLLYEKNTLLKD